ncbi:hypothetical protein BESB_056820 [Besnoitia besnoiti]|uniref:ATG C terminal domain-containing protein n=1 Tax=Besnoitia besnoiti TaxID=94643 RepID=A0A2A9MIE6_BESBE|nr:hypothetical protein BESB_056820 [Besnoitia besnoiti]PFH36031.1 hypothetical protein BESB_056820 [Besnoitia besnoiti]
MAFPENCRPGLSFKEDAFHLDSRAGTGTSSSGVEAGTGCLSRLDGAARVNEGGVEEGEAGGVLESFSRPASPSVASLSPRTVDPSCYSLSPVSRTSPSPQCPGPTGSFSPSDAGADACSPPFSREDELCPPPHESPGEVRREAHWASPRRRVAGHEPSLEDKREAVREAPSRSPFSLPFRVLFFFSSFIKEAFVSSLRRIVVGPLLKDLDEQQLHVALGKREVSVSRVQVQTAAANQLLRQAGVPLEIREVYVERIQWLVPWRLRLKGVHAAVEVLASSDGDPLSPHNSGSPANCLCPACEKTSVQTHSQSAARNGDASFEDDCRLNTVSSRCDNSGRGDPTRHTAGGDLGACPPVLRAAQRTVSADIDRRDSNAPLTAARADAPSQEVPRGDVRGDSPHRGRGLSHARTSREPSGVCLPHARSSSVAPRQSSGQGYGRRGDQMGREKDARDQGAAAAAERGAAEGGACTMEDILKMLRRAMQSAVSALDLSVEDVTVSFFVPFPRPARPRGAAVAQTRDVAWRAVPAVQQSLAGGGPTDAHYGPTWPSADPLVPPLPADSVANPERGELPRMSIEDGGPVREPAGASAGVVKPRDREKGHWLSPRTRGESRRERCSIEESEGGRGWVLRFHVELVRVCEVHQEGSSVRLQIDGLSASLLPDASSLIPRRSPRSAKSPSLPTEGSPEAKAGAEGSWKRYFQRSASRPRSSKEVGPRANACASRQRLCGSRGPTRGDPALVRSSAEGLRKPEACAPSSQSPDAANTPLHCVHRKWLDAPGDLLFVTKPPSRGPELCCRPWVAAASQGKCPSAGACETPTPRIVRGASSQTPPVSNPLLAYFFPRERPSSSQAEKEASASRAPGPRPADRAWADAGGVSDADRSPGLPGCGAGLQACREEMAEAGFCSEEDIRLRRIALDERPLNLTEPWVRATRSAEAPENGATLSSGPPGGALEEGQATADPAEGDGDEDDLPPEPSPYSICGVLHIRPNKGLQPMSPSSLHRSCVPPGGAGGSASSAACNAPVCSCVAQALVSASPGRTAFDVVVDAGDAAACSVARHALGPFSTLRSVGGGLDKEAVTFTPAGSSAEFSPSPSHFAAGREPIAAHPELSYGGELPNTSLSASAFFPPPAPSLQPPALAGQLHPVVMAAAVAAREASACRRSLQRTEERLAGDGLDDGSEPREQAFASGAASSRFSHSALPSPAGLPATVAEAAREAAALAGLEYAVSLEFPLFFTCISTQQVCELAQLVDRVSSLFQPALPTSCRTSYSDDLAAEGAENATQQTAYSPAPFFARGCEDGDEASAFATSVFEKERKAQRRRPSHSGCTEQAAAEDGEGAKEVSDLTRDCGTIQEACVVRCSDGEEILGGQCAVERGGDCHADIPPRLTALDTSLRTGQRGVGEQGGSPENGAAAVQREPVSGEPIARASVDHGAEEGDDPQCRTARQLGSVEGAQEACRLRDRGRSVEGSASGDQKKILSAEETRKGDGQLDIEHTGRTGEGAKRPASASLSLHSPLSDDDRVPSSSPIAAKGVEETGSMWMRLVSFVSAATGGAAPAERSASKGAVSSQPSDTARDSDPGCTLSRLAGAKGTPEELEAHRSPASVFPPLSGTLCGEEVLASTAGGALLCDDEFRWSGDLAGVPAKEKSLFSSLSLSVDCASAPGLQKPQQEPEEAANPSRSLARRKGAGETGGCRDAVAFRAQGAVVGERGSARDKSSSLEGERPHECCGSWGPRGRQQAAPDDPYELRRPCLAASEAGGEAGEPHEAEEWRRAQPRGESFEGRAQTAGSCELAGAPVAPPLPVAWVVHVEIRQVYVHLVLSEAFRASVVLQDQRRRPASSAGGSGSVQKLRGSFALPAAASGDKNGRAFSGVSHLLSSFTGLATPAALSRGPANDLNQASLSRVQGPRVDVPPADSGAKERRGRRPSWLRRCTAEARVGCPIRPAASPSSTVAPFAASVSATTAAPGTGRGAAGSVTRLMLGDGGMSRRAVVLLVPYPTTSFLSLVSRDLACTLVSSMPAGLVDAAAAAAVAAAAAPPTKPRSLASACATRLSGSAHAGRAHACSQFYFHACQSPSPPCAAPARDRRSSPFAASPSERRSSQSPGRGSGRGRGGAREWAQAPGFQDDAAFRCVRVARERSDGRLFPTGYTRDAQGPTRGREAPQAGPRGVGPFAGSEGLAEAHPRAPTSWSAERSDKSFRPAIHPSASGARGPAALCATWQASPSLGALSHEAYSQHPWISSVSSGADPAAAATAWHVLVATGPWGVEMHVLRKKPPALTRVGAGALGDSARRHEEGGARRRPRPHKSSGTDGDSLAASGAACPQNNLEPELRTPAADGSRISGEPDRSLTPREASEARCTRPRDRGNLGMEGIEARRQRTQLTGTKAEGDVYARQTEAIQATTPQGRDELTQAGGRGQSIERIEDRRRDSHARDASGGKADKSITSGDPVAHDAGVWSPPAKAAEAATTPGAPAEGGEEAGKGPEHSPSARHGGEGLAKVPGVTSGQPPTSAASSRSCAASSVSSSSRERPGKAPEQAKDGGLRGKQRSRAERRANAGAGGARQRPDALQTRDADAEPGTSESDKRHVAVAEGSEGALGGRDEETQRAEPTRSVTAEAAKAVECGISPSPLSQGTSTSSNLPRRASGTQPPGAGGATVRRSNETLTLVRGYSDVVEDMAEFCDCIDEDTAHGASRLQAPLVIPRRSTAGDRTRSASPPPVAPTRRPELHNASATHSSECSKEESIRGYKRACLERIHMSLQAAPPERRKRVGGRWGSGESPPQRGGSASGRGTSLNHRGVAEDVESGEASSAFASAAEEGEELLDEFEESDGWGTPRPRAGGSLRGRREGVMAKVARRAEGADAITRRRRSPKRHPRAPGRGSSLPASSADECLFFEVLLLLVALPTVPPPPVASAGERDAANTGVARGSVFTDRNAFRVSKSRGAGWEAADAAAEFYAPLWASGRHPPSECVGSSRGRDGSTEHPRHRRGESHSTSASAGTSFYPPPHAPADAAFPHGMARQSRHSPVSSPCRAARSRCTEATADAPLASRFCDAPSCCGDLRHAPFACSSSPVSIPPTLSLLPLPMPCAQDDAFWAAHELPPPCDGGPGGVCCCRTSAALSASRAPPAGCLPYGRSRGEGGTCAGCACATRCFDSNLPMGSSSPARPAPCEGGANRRLVPLGYSDRERLGTAESRRAHRHARLLSGATTRGFAEASRSGLSATACHGPPMAFLSLSFFPSPSQFPASPQLPAPARPALAAPPLPPGPGGLRGVQGSSLEASRAPAEPPPAFFAGHVAASRPVPWGDASLSNAAAAWRVSSLSRGETCGGQASEPAGLLRERGGEGGSRQAREHNTWAAFYEGTGGLAGWGTGASRAAERRVVKASGADDAGAGRALHCRGAPDIDRNAFALDEELPDTALALPLSPPLLRVSLKLQATAGNLSLLAVTELLEACEQFGSSLQAPPPLSGPSASDGLLASPSFAAWCLRRDASPDTRNLVCSPQHRRQSPRSSDLSAPQPAPARVPPPPAAVDASSVRPSPRSAFPPPSAVPATLPPLPLAPLHELSAAPPSLQIEFRLSAPCLRLHFDLGPSQAFLRRPRPQTPPLQTGLAATPSAALVCDLAALRVTVDPGLLALMRRRRDAMLPATHSASFLTPPWGRSGASAGTCEPGGGGRHARQGEGARSPPCLAPAVSYAYEAQREPCQPPRGVDLESLASQPLDICHSADRATESALLLDIQHVGRVYFIYPVDSTPHFRVANRGARRPNLLASPLRGRKPSERISPPPPAFIWQSQLLFSTCVSSPLEPPHDAPQLSLRHLPPHPASEAPSESSATSHPFSRFRSSVAPGAEIRHSFPAARRVPASAARTERDCWRGDALRGNPDASLAGSGPEEGRPPFPAFAFNSAYLFSSPEDGGFRRPAREPCEATRGDMAARGGAHLLPQARKAPFGQPSHVACLAEPDEFCTDPRAARRGADTPQLGVALDPLLSGPPSRLVLRLARRAVLQPDSDQGQEQHSARSSLPACSSDSAESSSALGPPRRRTSPSAGGARPARQLASRQRAAPSRLAAVSELWAKSRDAAFWPEASGALLADVHTRQSCSHPLPLPPLGRALSCVPVKSARWLKQDPPDGRALRGSSCTSLNFSRVRQGVALQPKGAATHRGPGAAAGRRSGRLSSEERFVEPGAATALLNADPYTPLQPPFLSSSADSQRLDVASLLARPFRGGLGGACGGLGDVPAACGEADAFCARGRGEDVASVDQASVASRLRLQGEGVGRRADDLRTRGVSSDKLRRDRTGHRLPSRCPAGARGRGGGDEWAVLSCDRVNYFSLFRDTQHSPASFARRRTPARDLDAAGLSASCVPTLRRQRPLTRTSSLNVSAASRGPLDHSPACPPVACGAAGAADGEADGSPRKGSASSEAETGSWNRPLQGARGVEVPPQPEDAFAAACAGSREESHGGEAEGFGSGWGARFEGRLVEEEVVECGLFLPLAHASMEFASLMLLLEACADVVGGFKAGAGWRRGQKASPEAAYAERGDAGAGDESREGTGSRWIDGEGAEGEGKAGLERRRHTPRIRPKPEREPANGGDMSGLEASTSEGESMGGDMGTGDQVHDTEKPLRPPTYTAASPSAARDGSGSHFLFFERRRSPPQTPRLPSWTVETPASSIDVSAIDRVLMNRFHVFIDAAVVEVGLNPRAAHACIASRSGRLPPFCSPYYAASFSSSSAASACSSSGAWTSSVGPQRWAACGKAAGEGVPTASPAEATWEAELLHSLAQTSSQASLGGSPRGSCEQDDSSRSVSFMRLEFGRVQLHVGVGRSQERGAPSAAGARSLSGSCGCDELEREASGCRRSLLTSALQRLLFGLPARDTPLSFSGVVSPSACLLRSEPALLAVDAAVGSLAVFGRQGTPLIYTWRAALYRAHATAGGRKGDLAASSSLGSSPSPDFRPPTQSCATGNLAGRESSKSRKREASEEAEGEGVWRKEHDAAAEYCVLANASADSSAPPKGTDTLLGPLQRSFSSLSSATRQAFFPAAPTHSGGDPTRKGSRAFSSWPTPAAAATYEETGVIVRQTSFAGSVAPCPVRGERSVDSSGLEAAGSDAERRDAGSFVTALKPCSSLAFSVEAELSRETCATLPVFGVAWVSEEAPDGLACDGAGRRDAPVALGNTGKGKGCERATESLHVGAFSSISTSRSSKKILTLRSVDLALGWLVGAADVRTLETLNVVLSSALLLAGARSSLSLRGLLVAPRSVRDLALTSHAVGLGSLSSSPSSVAGLEASQKAASLEGEGFVAEFGRDTPNAWEQGTRGGDEEAAPETGAVPVGEEKSTNARTAATPSSAAGGREGAAAGGAWPSPSLHNVPSSQASVEFRWTPLFAPQEVSKVSVHLTRSILVLPRPLGWASFLHARSARRSLLSTLHAREAAPPPPAGGHAGDEPDTEDDAAEEELFLGSGWLSVLELDGVSATVAFTRPCVSPLGAEAEGHFLSRGEDDSSTEHSADTQGASSQSDASPMCEAVECKSSGVASFFTPLAAAASCKPFSAGGRSLLAWRLQDAKLYIIDEGSRTAFASPRGEASPESLACGGGHPGELQNAQAMKLLRSIPLPSPLLPPRSCCPVERLEASQSLPELCGSPRGRGGELRRFSQPLWPPPHSAASLASGRQEARPRASAFASKRATQDRRSRPKPPHSVASQQRRLGDALSPLVVRASEISSVLQASGLVCVARASDFEGRATSSPCLEPFRGQAPGLLRRRHAPETRLAAAEADSRQVRPRAVCRRRILGVSAHVGFCRLAFCPDSLRCVVRVPVDLLFLQRAARSMQDEVGSFFLAAGQAPAAAAASASPPPPGQSCGCLLAALAAHRERAQTRLPHGVCLAGEIYSWLLLLGLLHRRRAAPEGSTPSAGGAGEPCTEKTRGEGSKRSPNRHATQQGTHGAHAKADCYPPPSCARQPASETSADAGVAAGRAQTSTHGLARGGAQSSAARASLATLSSRMSSALPHPAFSLGPPSSRAPADEATDAREPAEAAETAEAGGRVVGSGLPGSVSSFHRDNLDSVQGYFACGSLLDDVQLDAFSPFHPFPDPPASRFIGLCSASFFPSVAPSPLAPTAAGCSLASPQPSTAPLDSGFDPWLASEGLRGDGDSLRLEDANSGFHWLRFELDATPEPPAGSAYPAVAVPAFGREAQADAEELQREEAAAPMSREETSAVSICEDYVAAPAAERERSQGGSVCGNDRGSGDTESQGPRADAAQRVRGGRHAGAAEAGLEAKDASGHEEREAGRKRRAAAPASDSSLFASLGVSLEGARLDEDDRFPLPDAAEIRESERKEQEARAEMYSVFFKPPGDPDTAERRHDSSTPSSSSSPPLSPHVPASSLLSATVSSSASSSACLASPSFPLPPEGMARWLDGQHKGVTISPHFSRSPSSPDPPSSDASVHCPKAAPIFNASPFLLFSPSASTPSHSRARIDPSAAGEADSGAAAPGVHTPHPTASLRGHELESAHAPVAFCSEALLQSYNDVSTGVLDKGSPWLALLDRDQFGGRKARAGPQAQSSSTDAVARLAEHEAAREGWQFGLQFGMAKLEILICRGADFSVSSGSRAAPAYSSSRNRGCVSHSSASSCTASRRRRSAQTFASSEPERAQARHRRAPHAPSSHATRLARRKPATSACRLTPMALSDDDEAGESDDALGGGRSLSAFVDRDAKSGVPALAQHAGCRDEVAEVVLQSVDFVFGKCANPREGGGGLGQPDPLSRGVKDRAVAEGVAQTGEPEGDAGCSVHVEEAEMETQLRRMCRTAAAASEHLVVSSSSSSPSVPSATGVAASVPVSSLARPRDAAVPQRLAVLRIHDFAVRDLVAHSLFSHFVRYYEDEENRPRLASVPMLAISVQEHHLPLIRASSSRASHEFALQSQGLTATPAAARPADDREAETGRARGQGVGRSERLSRVMTPRGGRGAAGETRTEGARTEHEADGGSPTELDDAGEAAKQRLHSEARNAAWRCRHNQLGAAAGEFDREDGRQGASATRVAARDEDDFEMETPARREERSQSRDASPLDYSVKIRMLPLSLTLQQESLDAFEDVNRQLRMAGVVECSRPLFGGGRDDGRDSLDSDELGTEGDFDAEASGADRAGGDFDGGFGRYPMRRRDRKGREVARPRTRRNRTRSSPSPSAASGVHTALHSQRAGGSAKPERLPRRGSDADAERSSSESSPRPAGVTDRYPSWMSRPDTFAAASRSDALSVEPYLAERTCATGGRYAVPRARDAIAFADEWGYPSAPACHPFESSLEFFHDDAWPSPSSSSFSPFSSSAASLGGACASPFLSSASAVLPRDPVSLASPRLESFSGSEFLPAGAHSLAAGAPGRRQCARNEDTLSSAAFADSVQRRNGELCRPDAGSGASEDDSGPWCQRGGERERRGRRDLDAEAAEAPRRVHDYAEEGELPSAEANSSSFIRAFDMPPVLLRVDYVPRRLESGRICDGPLSEVVSFLFSFCRVEGLEVTLTRKALRNLPSAEALLQQLLAAWSEDFNRALVLKCVRGITPLRHALRFGRRAKALAQNLLRLAMRHWRADVARRPPLEVFNYAQCVHFLKAWILSASRQEFPHLSWVVLKQVVAVVLAASIEGITWSERAMRSAHSVLQVLDRRCTPGTCPLYPSATLRALPAPSRGRGAQEADGFASRVLALPGSPRGSLEGGLRQTRDARERASDIEDRPPSLRGRAESDRQLPSVDEETGALGSSATSASGERGSEWFVVQRGAEGRYEPRTLADGLSDGFCCVRRGFVSAGQAAARVCLPPASLLPSLLPLPLGLRRDGGLLQRDDESAARRLPPPETAGCVSPAVLVGAEYAQVLAKLLPVFILRPMLGFTEGMARTLQGTRNQLVPRLQEERLAKLREPSCRIEHLPQDDDEGPTPL